MQNQNRVTSNLRDKKYKPSIVYSQSLTQIVEKYEAVCNELHLIADEVPSISSNVDDLIARERALFDRHATLLNDALNMEIRSIEDAKAIMKLWKNEVVGNGESPQLSAGDQIVLSVCNFLEGK